MKLLKTPTGVDPEVMSDAVTMSTDGSLNPLGSSQDECSVDMADGQGEGGGPNVGFGFVVEDRELPKGIRY